MPILVNFLFCCNFFLNLIWQNKMVVVVVVMSIVEMQLVGAPLPHFQNECFCKTIQMKMSLICMKMDVQVKLIFIE